MTSHRIGVVFELDARGADHETATVLLHRLDTTMPAPRYAHPGDAGLDLHARHEVYLPPAGRALISTGVAIALPHGYAGFVHPRSGLAVKAGVTVLNAPGTIDAGYRGEVSVVLHNTDPEHGHNVRRGDRIAQLIIQRVAIADLVEVEQLPGSARGVGGFGSTGGWSKGRQE